MTNHTAPPAPSRLLSTTVVLLLLAGFAGQSLRHAANTSAIYDEPPHIASGYAYGRWNDYRLNPEHPPLIKRWAALGLVGLRPFPAELDLDDPTPVGGAGSITWNQTKRAWDQALATGDAQWLFAHTMLYGLRDDALRRLGAGQSHEVSPSDPPLRQDYLNDGAQLVFRARLPIIALALLLGLGIWWWARGLYGDRAAWLALAFYTFDPNFIAHGSLVTTDVGLAFLLLGAVLTLWYGLQRSGVWWLPASVLLVGLAHTAKFSAVLIVPIVALIVLLTPLDDRSWVVGRLRRLGLTGWRARSTLLLGLLGAIALSAWCMVWAAYDFRYAADASPNPRPLPVERVLRRAEAIQAWRVENPHTVAPREVMQQRIDEAELAGLERLVLFAADRRLLPEAYLHGFAFARMKSVARYSFLNGRYYVHGTWSYFPWAFLLKTPLITLALLGVALLALLRGAGPWRGELVFLFSPVLVWLVVSLTTSLNIGHRHLLPIYPFLYIFLGGLAAVGVSRALDRRMLVVLLLVGIGSSFVFAPPWRPQPVHPGALSFFNELAGGPRGGYRHLVDSNQDWGQDLPALARWLAEHPIDGPLYLCYFGMADPRFYGISHIKAPGGYALEPPFRGQADFPRPDRPVWIAISTTHLQGVYFEPGLRASWRQLLSRAERVGTAGRSIFLYRLDPTTF